MANSNQNPHAILVSYPLQGHVIPSVHLAIKLAQRGFTITFINTHFIHNQIKSGKSKNGGEGSSPEPEDIFTKVRKSSGLDIRYVTVSDGLPIGFDRSLNHDQFFAALLHVFSAHIEEAVVGIMKNEEGPPVTCLIADTFFVFPGMLAKKYGLLYVSFWTEAALVFTLYYHLDLLMLNRHFRCNDLCEDPITYIPGVKSIETKDMASYLQDSNTTSIIHQIIFKSFNDTKEYADFVLCNTIEELELDTITALQKKKSFFAVGPIFPAGFTNSSVATSLWSESDCSHWLNKLPDGSVLYVSFGSYAHLTKHDLLEIAYGLSQSKVRFLWVLRPDIVSSDDVNPLPDDFKREICDRGMIIPWCSQTLVLSHPSIGGFLTHCGWNSSLESIWSEVPLLCFPLLTDQFTNRKIVVDDWKVGINLCDQLRITRSEVSKKVKSLMSQEPGNDLRKSVKEIKSKFERSLRKDGSSERNMNQFIDNLKAKIQKKNEVIAEESNNCGSNGHLQLNYNYN